MMHEFMTLLRPLLWSAGLGIGIGIERQWGHKPAGLRTHVLVCLGSTTLVLITKYAQLNIGGPNLDPTRTIQGLITGIGFIGAGCIMQEKGSIVGLTTAATIFIAAAIGVAVGVHAYVLACMVTLLALIVLIGGRYVDRRLPAKEGSEQNGN